MASSNFSKVLQGVVAFVDVRSGADNRSRAVGHQLKAMGAEIVDRLSNDVTHVILKEGKKSTFEKAQKLNCHIVSVLWVERCRRKEIRVSEDLFPVSSEGEDTGLFKRSTRKFRSMQPNDFKEELAHSNERARRRLRNREKAKLDKYIRGLSFEDRQREMETPNNQRSPELVNRETNEPSSCYSRLVTTPPTLRDRLNWMQEVRHNCSLFDDEDDGTASDTSSTSSISLQSTSSRLSKLRKNLNLDRSLSDSQQKRTKACEFILVRPMNREDDPPDHDGNNTSLFANYLSPLDEQSEPSSGQSESLLQPMPSTGKPATRREISKSSTARRKSTSAVSKPTRVSAARTTRSRRTSAVDTGTQYSPKARPKKSKPSNIPILSSSSQLPKPVKRKHKLLSLSQMEEPIELFQEHETNEQNRLTNGQQEYSSRQQSIFGPVDEDPINLLQTQREAEQRFLSFSTENSQQERPKLKAKKRSKQRPSSQVEEDKENQRESDDIVKSAKRKDRRLDTLDQSREASKVWGGCRSKSGRRSEKRLSRKRKHVAVATPPSAPLPSDGAKRKRRTVEWDNLAVQAPKCRRVMLPTVVCTSMHRYERDATAAIIKALGGFILVPEVSETTTHVVCGNERRTLNVLRALSSGTWLLNIEWIYSSLEKGRWLAEEEFEMVHEFPACKVNRLKRFSSSAYFEADLFAHIGPIFVGEETLPSKHDLEELIMLAGGKVCNSTRRAKVFIGNCGRQKFSKNFSAQWILDSITSMRLLPYSRYKL